MNFTDYLKEQAQAMKGDFNGCEKSLQPLQPLQLDTTSELLFNKQFTLAVQDFVKIKDITLSLYEHKNKPKFRVGYWINESEQVKDKSELIKRFVTVVYLDASRNKSLQKKFNSKYVMNIDMIFVDTEFRGNKLARLLYNYIVKIKGYAILGDSKQYFGARKLWARLSKTNDLIVDIVNIKTGDIIDSNVVLHQGQYDSDFDKRLWKYNDSITHIRSLLKEIK